jgi:cell division protein FtsA
MAGEKIIGGLDVGTHTTQVVVGQKGEHDQNIEVIAVFEVPSEGIRKGVVVDVSAAAETMKRAIDEAEKIAGRRVDEFFISFSGTHILASQNVGSVVVSRADNEISEGDKERVLSIAQALNISPNREIIETIPLYYVVDQDQTVKDPIGMKGKRLELKTLIIHGSTPNIRNWEQSLTEAGVETVGRVFSNIASSRAVLSKNQKELGAAVLDIGGGISGLTVFEEGEIIHTVVLPVGSAHITNDIAIGLKINVDIAEKLKLEFGCLPGKGMIDLASYGEAMKVSKKELTDITRMRLEELFGMVNKELRAIGKEKLLPGGVVLVGGGAKLPGIVDIAKAQLKLPVQIGYPRGIEGIADRADDPSYATAIGLLLVGFDELSKKNYGSKKFNFGMNKGLARAIKRLFP